MMEGATSALPPTRWAAWTIQSQLKLNVNLQWIPLINSMRRMKLFNMSKLNIFPHAFSSFFSVATPFWVRKPENLILSRDDSGQIVCQADGIPRPQIQWLVNGEPIEGQRHHMPYE